MLGLKAPFCASRAYREIYCGPRISSLKETIKAAVVHSFDKALTIEDVPKPKADSGEVVVKIETCGLCHSDIHAAHGDWPFKPNLPLIPGHEAVGIVESVGNGVKEVKEGDRVAIPWMGYA